MICHKRLGLKKILSALTLGASILFAQSQENLKPSLTNLNTTTLNKTATPLVIHNGEVSVLTSLQKPNLILYFKNGNSTSEGRKIEWLKHPTQKGFFAVLAQPYRATHSLLITDQDGRKQPFEVAFVKKQYPSEAIKVAPNKLQYPPQTAKRIAAEYKEAMEIYSNSVQDTLFQTPFQKPLNSKITSHYGNARTYNGQLKSFHGGTDFRAPIGTNITASNSGVIRLAKQRFLSGGSVLIDHGGGIFTKYFHLSEIFVTPGQFVEKGELLAKSGNTGRSSGPHLHFGVAVNGVDVNPLDFIEKIIAIFEAKLVQALDINQVK